MNETYRKIVDIVERNREDGFEVPAVRVGDDAYTELLKDMDFVTKRTVECEWEQELEYDEASGLVANTEVIVDDSISGVVAADVRGLWRDE